jgi:hypothetical protein
MEDNYGYGGVEMPEERKRMVCAHCGNQTILVVRAEYRKKDFDWYSPGLKENHIHWSILQCETCDGISVHEMSYSTLAGVQHSNYKLKVLYPLSRPELPNLPVKVQKAYKDALKVQKVEPNACAVAAGRTLEAACNHEKALGKTLAEMAQQLRQLRNLGAHDAEDEISEEDVPIILDFLEAILEYLYVAPAKVAAVQARLKKTPKAAPQAP